MKRGFYSDRYSFGWISQYADDSENIKANGQVCRSGFAYRFYDLTDPLNPFYTREAICSTLNGIFSDLGDASLTNQCTAIGQGATCDYFFSDFHANTYMSGNCQCALDATMGYCPVFNQTYMDTYMDVMRDYWGRGTFCHSADRYDFVAQSECGLGLFAKDDPLWKRAVEQNWLMELWPANQGAVPGGCLEKYWPTSWTMLQEHQR